MDFRLAVMQDLPQLKAVYKEIVKNMDDNQIQIWDEVYPCEFFEDDIKSNRCYVLFDKGEIVSAFALCNSSSGENAVKWNDSQGKALYLDRFGVNVNHSRKGIGSLMLKYANELAKALGVEYLRLFVVDINKPAINLYMKNGFTKVIGIYDEVVAGGIVLHEFGYEVKI